VKIGDAKLWIFRRFDNDRQAAAKKAEKALPLLLIDLEIIHQVFCFYMTGYGILGWRANEQAPA
jgi:hypothetical protein